MRFGPSFRLRYPHSITLTLLQAEPSGAPERRPIRNRFSGDPAPAEFADDGAAAILPPLPVALAPPVAGAAGGASGAAARAPSPQVSGQAKAPTPAPSGFVQAPAAAQPAAQTDAATAQTTQILSDQAFDRTLDLEPTVASPPRRHASETLRRRGRRYREWR